jgi:hypothetical protein
MALRRPPSAREARSAHKPAAALRDMSGELQECSRPPSPFALDEVR